jgi:hypothetical protein
MYNLIKKIKGWFLLKHPGPYGWSPKEFAKARRWAKTQPHPKYPLHSVYSLWSYVNRSGVESEYKLQEINKVKNKIETNKNKTI